MVLEKFFPVIHSDELNMSMRSFEVVFLWPKEVKEALEKRFLGAGVF